MIDALDYVRRFAIVKIDSVSAFYKWVHFVSGLPKKDGRRRWLFRGQSRITWGLNRSFIRDVLGNDSWYNPLCAIYRDEKDLISREISLVESYKDFVRGSNKSVLQLLCEMQHIGLPTRLLDVSLSPLVSLFMACGQMNSIPDEPFSVWGLPFEMSGDFDIELKRQTDNFARWIEEHLCLGATVEEDDLKELYLIRAPEPTSRMNAQRGLFLAATSLVRDFEAMILTKIGAVDFTGALNPLDVTNLLELGLFTIRLLRFDFSPELLDCINKFLVMCNITPITMFPDQNPNEGAIKYMRKEVAHESKF